MNFLGKIFGDANARYVNTLKPAVEKINSLEEKFRAFSDAQLKGMTADFRERMKKGETLDDLLPEAFASVREASRRVSGKRHFDVQLMGGIVLHSGKIAEMRTGEGKTLVATLPAFLNALTGEGVHVVTVNDYLSRRDAVWMGQIYDALGMSVGVLNHDSSFIYDSSHKETNSQQPTTDNGEQKANSEQRTAKSGELDKERDVEGGFKIVHEFLKPVYRGEAYLADITYGTNNEFGFDYLRDNMVYSSEQMVQRGHNFAVVDEVDSILIDEARTPLIISAPDEESGKLYSEFSHAVPSLIEGEDYNIDEKLKAVSITEKGIEKMEKRLGLADIYAEGSGRYVHHLEQALKALVLFKLDRDYVIKNGEVIIVDEFTGRLMPGRRWSEGLHQAVEAKEGVKIEKESRTLATITFQNYFRLFKKLSGMTGTARTSAEEFHKVYKLDVVQVPTNKPMIRKDSSDRIYKTELGKFKAIAKEIKKRSEDGQSVLVGTVSIQKNEMLSSLLEIEGVTHNVLNAKNHEREAEIIAQAGRPGAVTVATNMAGRGVDIILGGNPPDESEAEKSRQAGGLHVIGTERHEARRIDDQLRGRAGRQGDPGSSQFFVSTEDDLARVFGGDKLKSVMNTMGVGDEDVIENRFISNAIQQAQTRIEGHHFDARKYVLEYDDVMNKHRTTIYTLRKNILKSENNRQLIMDWLNEQIKDLVRFHYNPELNQFNTEEIAETVKAMVPNIGTDVHERLLELAGEPEAEVSITVYLEAELERLYEEKEKSVGETSMRQLEKVVLLRTIDEIWMDHIEAMEHLRDSVRLRAYGQRDPLVEYKIEGQKMYEGLKGAIRTQVAGMIFKVGFVQQPVQLKGQEMRPEVEGEASYTQKESESAGRVATDTRHEDKIGRNDACPCGSGKKYKKCGLLNTEEHQKLMAGKK